MLVVDDNGELREFLSRKLSDSWSILEAPNADRALALLRDRNVDLLITDISMPGTSGLDLCRQQGLHSIAFCCLSTGQNGFAPEEAAAIAVRTVKQWQRENPDSVSVVFDVISSSDEALYRDLLV